MQVKPDWNSMSEEEKKNAKYAMIMALSARDGNGAIWPITFADDYQRDLLYPVCLPRSDGATRVMFFAEEFANGQLPFDLGYAPGYQLNAVPITSIEYWNSICYRDPVLNLSVAEQNVIYEYRNQRATSEIAERKKNHQHKPRSRY